jgi:hypothetical protein
MKKKIYHAAWGISGETACYKKITGYENITNYSNPINCVKCLLRIKGSKKQMRGE